MDSSLTKMEGDVDEKKLSRVKTSEDMDREQTEIMYQKCLDTARKTDLSSISDLNVVYVSGKDSSERPIVCICMSKLPDTGVNLDKFLLYIIRVMDPIVNSKYNLVYFHTNMSSKNKPPFAWLKNAYKIFSAK